MGLRLVGSPLLVSGKEEAPTTFQLRTISSSISHVPPLLLLLLPLISSSYI